MLTFMSGCCCLSGSRGGCNSCNSCGSGYSPSPVFGGGGFGGGGCPNGACGSPALGQPVYPPQGNLYSPYGNAPTAFNQVIPMTAAIPTDPLPTF